MKKNSRTRNRKEKVKMELKYYNILPTIILSIIIISHFWKVSGGDMATQFSIVLITFFQIIIHSIIRICFKFNLYKNIQQLLLIGFVVFILYTIYSQMWVL